MPAGFETSTPDGRLQLLTNQIYFRLEQKIEIPAGSGGWVGNYRDVSTGGLGAGDIPLLAIASPAATWAEVVGVGVWRVYTTSTLQPHVLYIFSQRRPPVSAHMSGAELYATDGSILWSSDYPIMRPLGVLSNPAPGSYSGVSLAGRSVAHIPQKRETTYALTFTSAGIGSCYYSSVQGYQVYRRDQQAKTGVVAWGSSVSGSGSAFSEDTGQYQYMCAPSASSIPLSQQISSVGWRSLIIDVTNI